MKFISLGLPPQGDFYELSPPAITIPKLSRVSRVNSADKHCASLMFNLNVINSKLQNRSANIYIKATLVKATSNDILRNGDSAEIILYKSKQS